MDDPEIIRIIRAAIPDVVAIYRFGSTVEGSTHTRSDIDLAALAPRPLSPLARFELQERLAVALHRDVDLVDLRAASTVMRMQVIAHGIPLAVFDASATDRFETYTYSDYARLNEERKAILEQVHRDRTVYGR
jgi:predicted nucleotidyltransferase